MKCCANIAGKQQSMWSFPCIFCKISKEFVGVSPLLTVGELRAYRAAYVKAGEPHKDAREFHNVIFDILLDADDNFLFIDLLNIPELHILLGVVSKILFFLDKEIRKEKVSNFLKTLNITREEYHGKSSLNGNDSKKFLVNAKKLELIYVEGVGQKEKVDEAIQCCTTFNEVKFDLCL